MIICATKDVFMKTKISEIAEGLETSLLYRTTAEGIKEAISQHNVSQVIIDLNLPNAIEMIKEVKKSFKRDMQKTTETDKQRIIIKKLPCSTQQEAVE